MKYKGNWLFLQIKSTFFETITNNKNSKILPVQYKRVFGEIT